MSHSLENLHELSVKRKHCRPIFMGGLRGRGAARSQGRARHTEAPTQQPCVKDKIPKPQGDGRSSESCFSAFLFFFLLLFCPLVGPGLLLKRAGGEDVINPQSPQVFSTKSSSATSLAPFNSMNHRRGFSLYPGSYRS